MFNSVLYKTLGFLFFVAAAYSQQHIVNTDSTAKETIPFQYYLFNKKIINNRFYRIIPENFLPFYDQLQINGSSTVWFKTRLALKAQDEKFNLEANLPYVLSLPLNLKYKREENLRLVFRVLEKIKDLFALYLAYKHLEKYGLFHQP